MKEIAQLMAEAPAIQNLEFLRQLIAEARAEQQDMDDVRLRMLQGTGMGTDSLYTPQEDR
jgi:hypothetical protein